MRFNQFIDADRDPLEKKPKLFDKNKDDKEWLITKNNDYGTVVNRAKVSGDVDIIFDAVDPQNSTIKAAVNPYKIGYYIKQPFGGTHGVKSATTPYLLAEFDDSWFAGGGGAVPMPTSQTAGSVFDASRLVPQLTENNLSSFPKVNHYVATNTAGTDGEADSVDGGQYWNTNAKNDGTANTVAHANFAVKPDAAKNAEARFMDGDYPLYAILGDLKTTEVIKAGIVRLVNFDRAAVVGLNGLPPVTGDPQPLFAESAGDLPEFAAFTPMVANTTPTFLMGNTVGASGGQYVPNLYMSVYIVYHKPQGWMQNDSLYDGLVESAVVLSDSDGAVPLTQAWLADHRGEFDLIIDYDNDGVFSYGLDGLTGLTVRSQISGYVWNDRDHDKGWDRAPSAPAPHP